MTSFIFLVYLADIVDNIRMLGILSCIAFLIGVISCGVVYADIYVSDDTRRLSWRLGKYSVISLLVSIFIVVFTPSKQGIYIMGGLKAGNEVIQSETGQKALKVINMKLDDYLNGEKQQ